MRYELYGILGQSGHNQLLDVLDDYDATITIALDIRNFTTYAILEKHDRASPPIAIYVGFAHYEPHFSEALVNYKNNPMASDLDGFWIEHYKYKSDERK